jgi:beta-barrel assembly-enhancing protease
MNLRRTTVAFVALTAMMGAGSAEAQFKPSKNDQVRLGQQAAAEVRRKERLLPASDDRVQIMRRVAGRLLAGIDTSREPWQYSFDVIDNKDVNAFAFPGGPIFFYRGLMDRVQTEDQLAGVLAHEITHIRNEHWANQYNDTQKRRLGLSIVLMLFRANRTTFDIAGALDTLFVGLPYSRRHETDADDRGLDMMVKAGYNPEGMADVFRILAQAGGSKGPEWLSTHPGDANRIRRIEERASKMPHSSDPQRRLPWAR